MAGGRCMQYAVKRATYTQLGDSSIHKTSLAMRMNEAHANRTRKRFDPLPSVETIKTPRNESSSSGRPNGLQLVKHPLFILLLDSYLSIPLFLQCICKRSTRNNETSRPIHCGPLSSPVFMFQCVYTYFFF